MFVVALQSTIAFRPGKDIRAVKICKNCKFYSSDKQGCKLFGNLNLVTGDIEYNFAAFERNQNGQCGPEGKYFYHIQKDNQKTEICE